ncbi:MAG TPA: glycoside hydrolase family 43 protein, partial [Bacilli bacterium]
TDNSVKAVDPYTAYVMGYFTESPQGLANDYNFHLAYSTDSLNWTPLNQNNPVAIPTLGQQGLRDPFILRKQDGTFVVMATDLKGTNFSGPYSDNIHIWDSTDLRTFTNYRLLPMNAGGMHIWAPEAFYDASLGQYAILWSGNTDYNRIYVSYTTDFITVTNPQVYFDAGFGVLDATMHTHNGVNYMYYKKESNNSIYGAKSTSLAPGSFNTTTYTSAIAHDVSEAPIVVKRIGENKWNVWVDSYYPVNAIFYAWESTNIDTNSWVEMNKRNYNAPLNSKHATVTQITQTELNNLIAYWGDPNWNRIKSYNYPDRYLRHASFKARLDAYAFDPYQDSMFKQVAGLIDPNGVSYESVNFPGYYLRVTGSTYDISLSQNDNTTAFKETSTFYIVSGWADATWSSLKSYKFPTRYIIKSTNYVLKAQAVTSSSSATIKADATFKIVR